MRVIFLICLFLSIATLSYSQDLTPEERLKLLDDDYFLEELKKAREDTLKAIDECLDNGSHTTRFICGKSAVHYLRCVMDVFYTQGEDVHLLIDKCSVSMNIYLQTLREEITGEY